MKLIQLGATYAAPWDFGGMTAPIVRGMRTSYEVQHPCSGLRVGAAGVVVERLAGEEIRSLIRRAASAHGTDEPFTLLYA